MKTQAEQGLFYTDHLGNAGWLLPVGWTPAIQAKRHTTPDLDGEATKAQPPVGPMQGGYKRSRITVQGIPLVIENPKGSVRIGVAKDGKRWSTTMRHHYGFVYRTEGADGDGVDVFVGPAPDSNAVFIVDQNEPTTGEFDEHKVMLGFTNAKEAKDAYHANYQSGWRGFGSMAEHTVEDFKDWLRNGDTTRPLLKADVQVHDPIPEGAHWIEAHPNGPGTEGHPLLIMPIKGSDGAARVIGGAKGKLNGLRLHGLKDPAKYKEEAAQRSSAQRKADKERRESMTPEQRQSEKDAIAQGKADRKGAEEAFIQKVMGSATGGQGGEHGDLFAGEEQDPKAAREAHKARLKEALKIAKEAEKKILLDAEARGKAGLAQVGGDAPMDLDQILTETQGRGGPGYNRALAKRATENGLTAEKLMEGVNDLRVAEGKPPKEPRTPEEQSEQQAKNIEIHKATKELQAAKAGAYREAVKESLEANQNYAELLAARAMLRQEYKVAAAKKKGITFEPGYQMAVTLPQEREALAQSLHEKLLTQHMVGFLEEVGEAYPDDSEVDPFKSNITEGMHASRGAGAFDLLHDVGLAALGQGVIDRDVVEALGPEGAAHIVARAIRQTFSPEDQQHVLDALEHHHLGEQEDHLPQVVQEAQEWKAKAAEFEFEMTESARDLPAAVELQKGKIEALKEARRVLGGALGRMEARAALIAALQGTPQTEQHIPLGRMAPEKAIQTAAALGLKEGGFSLHHEEGEAVLTINGAGMDSILKPVDTAALGEREVAATLKQGGMDEDNWLPAGFARRDADRYSNQNLEPPVFQRHHDVTEHDTPEQVTDKMQAWMGARMADGERPEDIVAHAYGGAQTGMSEESKATWTDTLKKMVPLRVAQLDSKGNPIPERDKVTGEVIMGPGGQPIYKAPRMRTSSEIAKDLAPMMQKFMGANPEQAGQTLQGQHVEQDSHFHEAVHRALAADPRLTAAYIPPGELTHEQQGHIRDFFYREHFGGAPNSDQAKKWRFDREVESLGPEPEKINQEAQSFNLFSSLDEEDAGGADQAASDEWIKWNNSRQQLEEKYGESADKPSLWDSYIQRMGGTKFAQETVQDLMRSQFNDHFHEHYQRLTGRKLLMAGAEVARSQEHLKMVAGDEEAEKMESERKAKQARMQNQGGRGFQTGKVGDRLRDSQANTTLAQAEQNQGAMFDLSEYDSPEEETPKDASEEGDEPTEAWSKPELSPGERYHLGTCLENQIRGAMPSAASAFQGRRAGVKVDEGLHMSGEYARQQRCIKAITTLKRAGLYLGAGCVYGGTLLKCERKGVTRSFYDWWISGEAPWVRSFGSDNPVEASPVFLKGFEPMVKVRCDNGAEIAVTKAHRFLGENGWVEAGRLSAGDRIAGEGAGCAINRDELLDAITSSCRRLHAPVSPSAVPAYPVPRASIHDEEPRHSPTDHTSWTWPFYAVHRSILAADARRSQQRFSPSLLASIQERALSVLSEGGPNFFEKSPDFPVNYSHDLRPCGGQPPSAEADGQDASPSLDDARARNLQNLPGGGTGRAEAHTRACRGSSRHSMTHSEFRGMPESGAGFPVAGDGNEPSRYNSQFGRQFSACLVLERDTSLQEEHQRLGTCGGAPFSFSTVLSVEEFGDQAVFDVSVPATHNYIAQGLVNHNSGKTGIMLGSLTTLHQQGKLKKGILAVPSVVQAQFGAEAIRFIDPESGFRVHAQPGESYQERLAAYRDPDQHAVVVTHQTLRDDSLQILADHMGGTVEQARDFLHSAAPKDAAAKMKAAFQAAGIDHNALMVDEAHGAMDRDGKEDSTLSKVIDAHSHNADYSVMATGDPFKNDTSEIWSNLNKIDPHRYPPESREEFMRRYGGDTALTKRSMAQELSRYWFNGRVAPEADCFKSNPKVALTPKQKQAADQIDLAAGKLRTGQDAVKWAKVLAPAKFEGVPEEQHAAIAEQVRKAVGTMRETAMNRVVNLDPEGGKMAEHVRLVKERVAEGKPCVIFASNLQAVANIHAAMEKAGIRATSLTGKDGSKDKATKVGQFQQGHADVIIMSDAGATGVNLQRGKCVIHHDLPKTAMVHNQRTARIWRLGQDQDVESITLQADHPWEDKNWERVKRKGVLGEVFQDPTGYLDDAGLAGELRDVRSRAGKGKKGAAA